MSEPEPRKTNKKGNPQPREKLEKQKDRITKTKKKGRQRFLFSSLGLVMLATVAGFTIKECSTSPQGSFISNPEYPEMNTIPVKASGILYTPNQRVVEWFNYSSAKLDPNNLKSLYSLLDEPNLLPESPFPGSKVEFSIRKRVSLNITDTQHPLPRLNVSLGLAGIDYMTRIARETAGFTFQPRDGQFTTYIRLRPDQNTRLDFNPDVTNLAGNGVLAVEACQGTFAVFARTDEDSIAYKESLCNSFGVLFEHTGNNRSYEDYKYLTENSTISIGSNRLRIPTLAYGLYNKLKSLSKPLYK